MRLICIFQTLIVYEGLHATLNEVNQHCPHSKEAQGLSNIENLFQVHGNLLTLLFLVSNHITMLSFHQKMKETG